MLTGGHVQCSFSATQSHSTDAMLKVVFVSYNVKSLMYIVRDKDRLNLLSQEICFRLEYYFKLKKTKLTITSLQISRVINSWNVACVKPHPSFAYFFV